MGDKEENMGLAVAKRGEKCLQPGCEGGHPYGWVVAEKSNKVRTGR